MNNKQRRKKYFIEKGFQTRFIIKFCLLVMLATVLMGVVLFFFGQRSTTVVLENTEVTVKTTADFILPILIQTIIVVTLFVGTATVFLTLFMSHRIAGPFYRLKREMKVMGSGDISGDFNIRRKDQLQDLATSINQMIIDLRGKHRGLKKEFGNFQTTWKDFVKKANQEIDKKDIEMLNKKVNDIKKAITWFKI